MAKSGQRPAQHQIIDQPQCRSPWQSRVELVLALGGWAVLLWLLHPIVQHVAAVFAAHPIPLGLAGHPEEVLLAACAATTGSHPPVIDTPGLKSPLRYLFEGSFTLALWALWIYWILPLVTLALWYAGVQLFYVEILQGSAVSDLVATLRSGGIIVGVTLLCMLGWTYYNYLWFLRRGERRNRHERIVLDSDLAAHFGLEPAVLQRCKQARRVFVNMTGDSITLSCSPSEGDSRFTGARPAGTR